MQKNKKRPLKQSKQDAEQWRSSLSCPYNNQRLSGVLMNTDKQATFYIIYIYSIMCMFMNILIFNLSMFMLNAQKTKDCDIETAGWDNPFVITKNIYKIDL